MARKGTVTYVMYATKEPELQAAFERVHEHLGKETYSRSGVIADLVKRKDEEIRSGLTRRDQIAGMREDIVVMDKRLAALESLVSDLVEELKR
jgi:hypothetical protein